MSLKDNLAKVKAGKTPKKKAARKKAPAKRRAVRKKRGATTIRIDRERFAVELIANSMNATAAYKAVSPKCTAKTAAQQGMIMLREHETIDFLTPMLEKLFIDAGIEAEYVFKRWVEMSQASPLDYFTVTEDGDLGGLDLTRITPAQRLNLKSIKITHSQYGRNINIEVCDQQKAVDTIAKHLGLLIDRLAEEDVDRIGDLLERGIKRIRQTKDLDGWKDVILNVD